jgi:hypothetical protein
MVRRMFPEKKKLLRDIECLVTVFSLHDEVVLSEPIVTTKFSQVKYFRIVCLPERFPGMEKSVVNGSIFFRNSISILITSI